mmetsp:Transcript_33612/g.49593  ORF Transcript_33612/g.49593 Transcript_33612/m.49593 type:complete len:83 (-) Transcript_33612:471-719(-)
MHWGSVLVARGCTRCEKFGISFSETQREIVKTRPTKLRPYLSWPWKDCQVNTLYLRIKYILQEWMFELLSDDFCSFILMIML